jgi:acyl-CoA-binding protein
MEMEDEFKSASEFLSKQGGGLKLNDQNRLDFYGLYKQATMGDNTTSKPGFFEMTARAKW